MSRNIGCLSFTYEALAKMLAVPYGHAVTAVVPQTGDDVANQRVRLIVEGPKMPRHVEGDTVMHLTLDQLLDA